MRTASKSNGEVETGLDADLGNKNIFTLMAVKLKGKIGTEKNNEQEQEKIHTPSSLFNNPKEMISKFFFAYHLKGVLFCKPFYICSNK